MDCSDGACCGGGEYKYGDKPAVAQSNAAPDQAGCGESRLGGSACEEACCGKSTPVVVSPLQDGSCEGGCCGVSSPAVVRKQGDDEGGACETGCCGASSPEVVIPVSKQGGAGEKGCCGAAVADDEAIKAAEKGLSPSGSGCAEKAAACSAPCCAENEAAACSAPCCAASEACGGVGANASKATEEQSQKWVRIALGLAVFTIIWNMVEGVVSIAYGVEEESVALSSFGVDSFIEVFSAVVVLIHLWTSDLAGAQGTNDEDSAIEARRLIEKERLATRIIGTLLTLLGIAAIGTGIFRIVTEGKPDSAVPSLVIAAVSLSFMFALFWGKREAAHQLHSQTLHADARCSLGCIELSLLMLLGSILFLMSESLWWADAAAALVMGGLIAQDGVNAVCAANRADFEGGCPCCT